MIAVCEGKMPKLTGGWARFKEEWVQCSNTPCETWSMIRVKEEVKLNGASFMCGLCAWEACDELKKLNEKVNESDEQMRKDLDDKVKNIGVKVQVMETSVEEEKAKVKDIDVKMKVMESSVNDEKAKWSVVASKSRKSAETNAAAVQSIKEDMRKEIGLISVEERRKKRVVVFGMHEKDDVSDQQQAETLLENLGLEMDVGIKDIFRLKKKDDISTETPLMIEFENESDKWKIIKRKANLRTKEGYESVFLEADMSLEVRKKKAIEYKEKKRLKAEAAAEREQGTEVAKET